MSIHAGNFHAAMLKAPRGFANHPIQEQKKYNLISESTHAANTDSEYCDSK